MVEKDFQLKFNLWLKHRHYKTGAFELKMAKGRSIPFVAVKEHQENALYAAKHGNFTYKIPDDSIGQKPFDCFMLVMVPAFVVIMFYRRGQKEFFMIDIDIWLREKQDSVRRSLTEERAREIGTPCYLA